MIQLDVLAGKMSFDGKKVSPDQRKGILRVVIDPDNDKVEVQWLDRSGDPPAVEDRWTSPVTIEAVPAAKTGKVYVLKPENGEKQFVWIQQQSTNPDADAAGFAVSQVDNLEALINQMQMFAQMRSGKDAAEMYMQIFGGDEDQVGEDQMLVDLGHHGGEHDHDDDDGEDMEELVEQLLAGGDVDENQLAAILLMQPGIQQAVIAQFVMMAGNFLAHNPQLMAGLVPAQSPNVTPAQPVDVAAVVQSEEALVALASHESIRNKLLALCPENETDIVAVLRSPQFGEAMRSLTEGIYSEQILLLFTSLGLPHPSNIQGDPFEALCQAIERKYKKSN